MRRVFHFTEVLGIEKQKELVGNTSTDCFLYQAAIRDFLKVRTSYDVLPLSFRLIMLDNDLLIRTCVNILMQNSMITPPTLAAVPCATRD